MKVLESRLRATESLKEHCVMDPNLEAEVLVRHTLGMQRAEYFAGTDQPLNSNQTKQIDELIRRRIEGEPLAYILGHREFYGLDFVVDARVLVPRQETELLVDKVLEFARWKRADSLDIADVGTGSGAIAVAVAHEMPRVTVQATDIDPKALAVANINRHRHGLANRLHLYQGDLLEPLSSPVDVILSNPPYIPTSEITTLPQEVRREPTIALDGGGDGLEVTRRLVRQAPAYIRPGGCILLEIDPEQLYLVKQAAQEAMPAASVSFARDLMGQPRVIIIALPSNIN